PPPAEKTPTPQTVKSPSPVPVIESAPLTRALSPVDFDSDPEPLPEPEPSSDEESPPPPPAPTLSAFRPQIEQKQEDSSVMGVPKSKASIILEIDFGFNKTLGCAVHLLYCCTGSRSS
ncbi:unnamed protein product, partial [Oikopleura dioica]